MVRVWELMAKRIVTSTAAAAIIGIFSIAGLLFAQKNQSPWDDYRVEGDLTTIHVQGNVYMIHGAGRERRGSDRRHRCSGGEYWIGARLRQG